MTAPVFVDTNILVYARDSGDPRRQPLAADWLAFLWREQAGRLSAQVLSEYYVTVTRKLKPGLPASAAWEDVLALMAWEPQPVDADLMRRAREVEARHSLSWWDSLVVAAAQAQDCALLLTEDLQDGADYGGVIVRDPFRLTVSEALPLYATRAQAVRPAPQRGRPKRKPV